MAIGRDTDDGDNPYLCLRIKRVNSGWDPIERIPLRPAVHLIRTMRPD